LLLRFLTFVLTHSTLSLTGISRLYLFRLSDASGKLEFTEEGSGPGVNQDMLDSNDVFILDVHHQVFVWVGAKANADEHKNGIHYAQEYLKREDRLLQTPITKVMDGGDNDMFHNALNRY
jgi:gelsolin